MRILALVHRVPYPPNKGEKIRAYNELRFLAEQGHTVDLATFADVEEDTRWTDELLKLCRQVAVVRIDRRLSRARSVLALPRSLPLSVGYFESFRLRRIVRHWTARRAYDVAFCYSSPMAEYVRELPPSQPHLVRVMDFVDIDSDKWAQYATHSREPLASVYRFEARSLAAYERTIAEAFDASTFVSAKEVEMFRAIAPRARRVLDVPNGVDADFFGATARSPRPSRGAARDPGSAAGGPGAGPLLVFVGQMDYFANVDGVTYFADEVMPRLAARLPGVEFRIVGRAPAPEVQKLATRPGITVTGAVADVRQHLAEATLMVAPLRIARGIQNKVLEAMAARVPVVLSPAALEGIEAEPGTHAIVCRDPGEYVEAIVRLAGDEAARASLASKARLLVEQRYGWPAAMRKLEGLMIDLCAESQATRGAAPATARAAI